MDGQLDEPNLIGALQEPNIPINNEDHEVLDTFGLNTHSNILNTH
jgi:hypothetical protein